MYTESITTTSQELLRVLEQVISERVAGLEGRAVCSSSERLADVLRRLEDERRQGRLTPKQTEEARAQVRQLEIISRGMEQVHQQTDELKARITKQFKLSSESDPPLDPGWTESHMRPYDKPMEEFSGNGTQELGTEPYQIWFLANLPWPYPGRLDRDRMLAAVHCHSRAQLSNWFVNSRRRSGWSELVRRFGKGTKEGMEALFKRIELGDSTDEELQLVTKVRAYFEDDGSSVVRPDLRVLVDEIESQIRTEYLGDRKRKFTEDDDESDGGRSRKCLLSGSRSSSKGSSSSEGSRSTLGSSPTFRSSLTLTSFEDLQMEFSQPQPLPRGLQAHNSRVDSPAASEYPKGGIPASRRCVSDSRSHISPKRSTPPYRSVSSSFALGMESTLAGSLTMPIDPDFLATCPTAGSAWNGGESPKTSDFRFASTSPSTSGADHSDETSLNTTTTSNTWYETLQDDRWTDLYPWLGRSLGSDSLSGLDMFGQDEEVNWLMGTELAGLC